MTERVFFLCICAPGADDRRARMEGLAHQHAIPMRFMTGADARRLEQEELLTRYEPEKRDRIGRLAMTRSEQACLESHARALSAFLDSDSPYSVIFEDNADFGETLTRFLDTAPLDDLDFDIIRLEQRKPSRWTAPIWRNEKFALAYSPHIGAGVSAMLYSRRGAEKALRYVTRYHYGYDTGIGLFWRAGLRTLTALPPPACRAAIPSTVERVDAEFQQDRSAAPRLLDLSPLQLALGLKEHLERQICKYLFSAAYTIEAKLRS